MRYTDESGDLYQFNEQLMLDNINLQELLSQHPTKRLDLLIAEQIKLDIKELRPDVVIIDNIKYLAQESTQDASTSLNLIKELKTITKEFDISCLS